MVSAQAQVVIRCDAKQVIKVIERFLVLRGGDNDAVEALVSLELFQDGIQPDEFLRVPKIVRILFFFSGIVFSLNLSPPGFPQLFFFSHRPTRTHTNLLAA